MPWGLEEGSQRRQRPSDGGEGEQIQTETLEEGRTLCLHLGPETHRDPVTRSRRTFPLHCCLMSVEALGAHAPQRTVTEGPRMSKCQIFSIPS